MDERLNQLAAAWRAQGRRVYEVPAGVGVEFDDGNDAWWVLPGEPSSSVDVSPDAGTDAEVRRLLALFETVNARRRQVVHVLRHYIASQRYFLDRSRTGHWGVMTEWGMSSHVNVGAWLTKRAAEEAEIAVPVRALLEHGIVRRPSPKRVARHLAAVGDPPDERPFPAETPTIKIPSTVMTVETLRLMRLPMLYLSGMAIALTTPFAGRRRRRAARTAMPAVRRPGNRR